MSVARLRDLIRNVRMCKTASEERGLIQKECAAIRQGFREGNPKTRSRNMLKLLYIAMLGYATEFGQMEVVKLLAQNEYGDKRVGYLTLGILMDETHEVLTLAENHIKKDLGKTNPFIQSLALDVVANIAGEDMSRDVLHEVQLLVDSTNVHLKKKACLAGVRIVRKVPEFTEVFLGKLDNCFAERNHGALLCSLTLINECLATPFGAPFLTQFRQQVTAAVRVLKQLVLSAHAMEHDVNGVADPFLQVKLLQFLRITGTGSDAASEAMNDVLAQVATNTDPTKNVGSAILYECVRTINAINADDGLRLLGVNTVGKFLLSTQNNTRFVALATLLKVLEYDVAAVQRHQSIIIDCLKDPDTSIKKRALDLTIALIDTTNVRVLVPDLLGYLEVCDDEIKGDLVVKLCAVLEAKSPTPEWQVQLSLNLFKKGKHFVPEPFAVRFIALLTQRDATVHRDAVVSLWEDLSTSFDASLSSRTAFLAAAVWALGEYSSVLADSGVASAEKQWTVLSRVLTDIDNHTVKLYAMTAAAKLATRHPSHRSLASGALSSLASSLNCEIQQRASEYVAILQGPPSLCAVALGPMPVINVIAAGLGEGVAVPVAIAPAGNDLLGAAPAPTGSSAAPTSQPASTKSFIDDLFAAPAPTAAAPPAAAGYFAGAPQQPSGHLFVPSLAAPAQPAQMQPAPARVVDDLFGSPVQAPPPPQPQRVQFEAFTCEDFTVTIAAGPRRAAELPVDVSLRSSSARLDGIAFFVAVPKTCSVAVMPLPSTSVAPGAALTQSLTVTYPNGEASKLSLRIKIVYSSFGQEKTHLFQVDRPLV